MQAELNSSAPEMTVLVHTPTSEAAVPEESGIRVVREPRARIAEHARNVFVLARATELSDVSEFVSIANRRHQLRALFVRDDVDARWLPQCFERAGLRTLRNTLVHSDLEVPKRVLTAWWHGAQDALIADASVAHVHLFVVSCALDHYHVAFDDVPALKDIPEDERKNFRIDEDGSYLHWPVPDIHIDLDVIRAAIDPEWRAQLLAEKLTHDRRYGAAIAELRLSKGLKQSEIPGLSERQLRRIERGAGTSYESLRRLAEAHGMKLDVYLEVVAAALAKISSDRSAAGKRVRVGRTKVVRRRASGSPHGGIAGGHVGSQRRRLR